MSTMTIDLHLFEALTGIGVTPDSARRVERQVELAIAQGQQANLMTKQDGLALKIELKADIAELRDEMRRGFNDLTWRLVTFVVAANGLTLAAFKYIG